MPASSSVFLNVSNIDKSLEWYKALGFKVDSTSKSDNGKLAYAELKLQGADLGLGDIRSNDDEGYRQWVSTPLGAGVLIYFTVPDVDRYHKLAQASRATIEMPITDRPYGRMFTVNDPDGYTISFITEGKPAKEAAKPKRTPQRNAPKKVAKTAAKGAKRSAKRKAR